MILTCRCGQTNRLRSQPNVRLRCGKCKRIWTPAELACARPEPEPEMPNFLEREEDDVMIECNCGWEGTLDDADFDDEKDVYRCPDCEKKLKVPDA